jgi:hypothetical protein
LADVIFVKNVMCEMTVKTHIYFCSYYRRKIKNIKMSRAFHTEIANGAKRLGVGVFVGYDADDDTLTNYAAETALKLGNDEEVGIWYDEDGNEVSDPPGISGDDDAGVSNIAEFYVDVEPYLGKYTAVYSASRPDTIAFKIRGIVIDVSQKIVVRVMQYQGRVSTGITTSYYLTVDSIVSASDDAKLIYFRKFGDNYIPVTSESKIFESSGMAIVSEDAVKETTEPAVEMGKPLVINGATATTVEAYVNVASAVAVNAPGFSALKTFLDDATAKVTVITGAAKTVPITWSASGVPSGLACTAGYTDLATIVTAFNLAVDQINANTRPNKPLKRMTSETVNTVLEFYTILGQMLSFAQGIGLATLGGAGTPLPGSYSSGGNISTGAGWVITDNGTTYGSYAPATGASTGERVVPVDPVMKTVLPAVSTAEVAWAASGAPESYGVIPKYVEQGTDSYFEIAYKSRKYVTGNDSLRHWEFAPDRDFSTTRGTGGVRIIRIDLRPHALLTATTCKCTYKQQPCSFTVVPGSICYILAVFAVPTGGDKANIKLYHMDGTSLTAAGKTASPTPILDVIAGNTLTHAIDYEEKVTEQSFSAVRDSTDSIVKLVPAPFTRAYDSADATNNVRSIKYNGKELYRQTITSTAGVGEYPLPIYVASIGGSYWRVVYNVGTNAFDLIFVGTTPPGTIPPYPEHISPLRKDIETFTSPLDLGTLIPGAKYPVYLTGGVPGAAVAVGAGADLFTKVKTDRFTTDIAIKRTAAVLATDIGATIVIYGAGSRKSNPTVTSEALATPINTDAADGTFAGGKLKNIRQRFLKIDVAKDLPSGVDFNDHVNALAGNGAVENDAVWVYAYNNSSRDIDVLEGKFDSTGAALTATTSYKPGMWKWLGYQLKQHSTGFSTTTGDYYVNVPGATTTAAGDSVFLPVTTGSPVPTMYAFTPDVSMAVLKPAAFLEFAGMNHVFAVPNTTNFVMVKDGAGPTAAEGSNHVQIDNTSITLSKTGSADVKGQFVVPVFITQDKELTISEPTPVAARTIKIPAGTFEVGTMHWINIITTRISPGPGAPDKWEFAQNSTAVLKNYIDSMSEVKGKYPYYVRLEVIAYRSLIGFGFKLAVVPDADGFVYLRHMGDGVYMPLKFDNGNPSFSSLEEMTLRVKLDDFKVLEYLRLGEATSLYFRKSRDKPLWRNAFGAEKEAVPGEVRGAPCSYDKTAIHYTTQKLLAAGSVSGSRNVKAKEAYLLAKAFADAGGRAFCCIPAIPVLGEEEDGIEFFLPTAVGVQAAIAAAVSVQNNLPILVHVSAHAWERPSSDDEVLIKLMPLLDVRSDFLTNKIHGSVALTKFTDQIKPFNHIPADNNWLFQNDTAGTSSEFRRQANLSDDVEYVVKVGLSKEAFTYVSLESMLRDAGLAGVKVPQGVTDSGSHFSNNIVMINHHLKTHKVFGSAKITSEAAKARLRINVTGRFADNTVGRTLAADGEPDGAIDGSFEHYSYNKFDNHRHYTCTYDLCVPENTSLTNYITMNFTVRFLSTLPAPSVPPAPQIPHFNKFILNYVGSGIRLIPGIHLVAEHTTSKPNGPNYTRLLDGITNENIVTVADYLRDGYVSPAEQIRCFAALVNETQIPDINQSHVGGLIQGLERYTAEVELTNATFLTDTHLAVLEPYKTRSVEVPLPPVEETPKVPKRHRRR